MRTLSLFRICILLCFILLSCSDSDAQTVYVTRTGKKYHREDCQYLRQSKIDMSLKEAKKVYDPCSVCKPPTDVTSPRSEAGSSQVPTRKLPPTPTVKTPTVTTTSSQCTASTKSGSRCKRTTTSASGRCWQHQ